MARALCPLNAVRSRAADAARSPNDTAVCPIYSIFECRDCYEKHIEECAGDRDYAGTGLL